MPLTDGSRIGPYTIGAPLGAGGMGEVYRATDTRLKRQVAVKILPAALAADPERLARFQREAEVLASLNHAHIATIYGVEDAGGVRALVMELVDGPTLAGRIAQGPMPVDEALSIARQIADALQAAHEQGIVHRDLKPANVKIREDGTVKVLDFGLAKLTESARAVPDDPSQSPTLTSPVAMSGMGLILGTAAYMSPEQARGRTVDKRTDIWAFGAVLYEMLTGARAFAGEDIAETMAAVVKSTPDWRALPADVPPHVVTLIQRCLEKDRNARIGDIAVVRYLLSDDAARAVQASAAAGVPSVAAPPWRQFAPWILAAALAGAAVGWLLPRRTDVATPVTRLQLSASPADHIVGSIASVRPSRTAVALSPDGRTVVFAGMRGSASQLYIRALDRADAMPIAGTEGALAPFFSPDGAWIGFRADNRVKKVPAAGGTPATIAETPAARDWGASWGEDGTIFFADSEGIFRVGSGGGPPATLTTRDAGKNERHLLPHALPGGSALLFTTVTGNVWDTANVVLLSLETGERRVLIEGGADARYVNTGHIVYVKSGTLMAVPFDLRSKQVTGASVTLIEDLMQGVNAPNAADETGAGQFAVSSSGTLVYLSGGVSPNLESSWRWVDRTGTAEPESIAPAGPYLFPRLSPDGQKVAVNVRRLTSRTSDIWVYDLARGAPTRLTFDGSNSWPVWSPDGRRIVYGASTSGAANLHIINADGSGKPERLTTSDYTQVPASWASGTGEIAFLQRPSLATTGIWVLAMQGDRKPKLFLESRFNLSHPEFSPDGRLIAYVSNESGTREVYVQTYPGPGEKIRISTDGGMEPIWNAIGRELFYRSGKLDVLSASIRSLAPLEADRPRVLFTCKPGEYDSTTPVRSWNVSPDGRRFLMPRFEYADKPITAMHIVLNWTEELKRLAPPK